MKHTIGKLALSVLSTGFGLCSPSHALETSDLLPLECRRVYDSTSLNGAGSPTLTVDPAMITAPRGLAWIVNGTNYVDYGYVLPQINALASQYQESLTISFSTRIVRGDLTQTLMGGTVLDESKILHTAEINDWNFDAQSVKHFGTSGVPKVVKGEVWSLVFSEKLYRQSAVSSTLFVVTRHQMVCRLPVTT